ncbi:hypothetical protein ABVT39_019860 [Epinephelus coioides]
MEAVKVVDVDSDCSVSSDTVGVTSSKFLCTAKCDCLIKYSSHETLNMKAIRSDRKSLYKRCGHSARLLILLEDSGIVTSRTGQKGDAFPSLNMEKSVSPTHSPPPEQRCEVPLLTDLARCERLASVLSSRAVSKVI